MGIWWTVDQHCSAVKVSFSWIAYPGWTSFEIQDSGHHTVWQGSVDSNTTASEAFTISIPPGSYVVEQTGQGSYNCSSGGPEWAVTITEG